MSVHSNVWEINANLFVKGLSESIVNYAFFQ